MKARGIGAISCLLLAGLLLAACQQSQPANPGASAKPVSAAPSGVTPELAVRCSLNRLKADDLDGLAACLLPPPAYKDFRAQWQTRVQARLADVDPATRRSYARFMHEWSQADAETRMRAKLEPYLAAYASTYRQQLPIMTGFLRIMLETRITRDEHMTGAQKNQARGVLDALVRWVEHTDWGNRAKAEQAVTIVADAVRRIGVPKLADWGSLAYPDAMQRLDVLLADTKKLLAVYGLVPDRVLDTVTLRVLEQSADRARVEVSMRILGQPMSRTLDMRRVGQRWYPQRVIRAWRKEQAKAAVAASVGTPAATASSVRPVPATGR